MIDSEADGSVFYEIFTEREYKILDNIISKASSPILDIGAHVGMFSIYANCFNSDVQIYAFEPEERNFTALKNNFKENVVKNVIAKNVAVAAEIGVREFNISSDSHNHSLIKIENEDGEVFPIKKVSCTTIEQIFLKNNLQSVSLVKMDCEGAEFEILANLKPEILAKIGAIYIEYHQYGTQMNPEVLRQILIENGFKVQMKPSHFDKKFGFILAVR